MLLCRLGGGGGGWQSGKVGGRRRGLSADWFICAAYLPLGWQAQRKRRRAGEGHEAVRGGGHMEPQGQQGARSEQQRQAWKMMVNMHREQPNGFLQSAHWDRRYPSQPRAIQTGFPHWCLKPIRTTESRGTPFIPPLERGMRRVFDAPREKSLGASLRSTAPPSVRTHRSRCWRKRRATKEDARRKMLARCYRAKLSVWAALCVLVLCWFYVFPGYSLPRDKDIVAEVLRQGDVWRKNQTGIDLYRLVWGLRFLSSVWRYGFVTWGLLVLRDPQS